MNFKTKGETLVYLSKKNFRVPKLFLTDKYSLKSSKERILKKIKSKFKKKIIIRSSSKSEDNKNFSNAGKFLSVPNIEISQSSLILNSIRKVFDSYKSNLNNQIIIQEMLENVKISGVCSTVDLYNYLPVTIINYYIGKSTDIVTSGKKNTFSISIADKKYLNKSNKFYRLLIEVERIKKLFKSELLDIEFAIDSKKKVYI